MVPSQNDRVVVIMQPTSATNAEVITSSSVDTNGYLDARIVSNGNTVGTSFAPTSITVQESDDNTTFTAIAAVSGASATSATAAVLLTGRSAAKTLPDYICDITKRGNRKRYLRVVITPTTTQTWSVWASLAGPTATASPDTAAERNAVAYANT